MPYRSLLSPAIARSAFRLGSALLVISYLNPSAVAQSFKTTVVEQQTGKCFDISGYSLQAGGALEQYTCNNQLNQQFQFVPVGNGVYSISPQQTGNLCLDAGAGESQITQQTCNAGNPAQQWTLGTTTTKNAYALLSQARSDCADVYGERADDGAPVGTYTCGNGKANQAFFLSGVPQGNTLVLNVSEDAYGGDAQFTVRLDGAAIGGVQTAIASRAAGASQNITLTGAFGASSHTVSVTFLNDAYGGTPTTDRNLYVNSATFDNGVTQVNRPLLSTGDTATFTVALAAITAPPAPVSQETYLTTPNIPKPGPLPLNSAVGLSWGLSFEPGAGTQVVGMRFGTSVSGANITTGQQLRDTFFTNSMEGNLTQAIGSPNDTGQTPGRSPFAAVARTYAVGDPNDLIPVLDDGVHIRAACSNNHTDCSLGHVYGGMLTMPQAEIRPGMTVKVRYKSAKGDHSWPSIWMFSITAQPPASGSKNMYDGTAEFHGGGDDGIGKPEEIDINDNYSRFGAGTPTGQQIDFGTPDIYGAAWDAGKAPHFTYGATGNGFVTHTGANPDYTALTSIDWSASFHDLTLDWRPDGNMNLFVDNVLVTSAYEDYTKVSHYVKNGASVPVGMELLLFNEAVPQFAPGVTASGSGIVDNDGLGVDGWAMVVQEIGVWQGNIANPNNSRATATSAY